MRPTRERMSFGAFLRLVRDQPGFGLRATSTILIGAALVAAKGWTALVAPLAVGGLAFLVAFWWHRSGRATRR